MVVAADTLMADVPDLPSLVAVIVADPAACADTRPVLDTVAAAVFELDHVIARLVRTFPLASFVVAVNCAGKKHQPVTFTRVHVPTAVKKPSMLPKKFEMPVRINSGTTAT